MKKNRRFLKNYILNKDFQFKIIFYNLMYLTLGSLITSFIILFPDIVDMSSASSPEVRYDAAINFLKSCSRIIPGLIILFSVSFVHMVILTHRICGPVIHFTRAIREFKSGNLKARINLRKNDYLKKESLAVNSVADEFIDYINMLKSDISLIESKIEEGKLPETEEIKKLKEKLYIFKTS